QKHMRDSLKAFEALDPMRIEFDRADGVGFARVLWALFAALPRRADPPDEIECGIAVVRQCDRDLAVTHRGEAISRTAGGGELAASTSAAQAAPVARSDTVCQCLKAFSLKVPASPKGSALAAGVSRGHFAGHVPSAWAPSPCQPAFNDIKISLYPLDMLWHGSSATYFRRADRRLENRWRADTAAHPGAPCRSRTDGFRSDRDSAPVAAPTVAASAAPRRSGPGRTLPRRLLGLLSPWRARQRLRSGAPAYRPTQYGRSGRCARPRAACRGARRAPPRGADLFPPRRPARAPRGRSPIPAAPPRNGIASAGCMSPTPRSRTRSAPRSPTSRSARSLISAPAPGACLNCLGPISSAVLALICRSICWHSPAPGSIAPD